MKRNAIFSIAAGLLMFTALGCSEEQQLERARDDLREAEAELQEERQEVREAELEVEQERLEVEKQVLDVESERLKETEPRRP